MSLRTTSVATPTAYLVGPGKLKLVNGRLSFSTGEGTPLRLDADKLEMVLCYGHVGATGEALQVLFEHDVYVAWMSPGGYTLLLNRIIARCQAAGLEVNLGALHEYRPGRPSLACDLIEPHRVGVVDRWVIELCNQMKVKPDDFVNQDGGVRLKPERFGVVIGWWEERWLSQHFDKVVEQSVETITKLIRSSAK